MMWAANHTDFKGIKKLFKNKGSQADTKREPSKKEVVNGWAMLEKQFGA